jgi:CRISPR/Cas system CMR subunit Cmr4 (Cas7 group RAMP superfamily)
LEENIFEHELPDHFVYRQLFLKDNKLIPQVVLPGKAIRQALLAVPIERKLGAVQEVSGDANKSTGKAGDYLKWFGSTENRGLIAVKDVLLDNTHTETIYRIELSEHTMENKNLFSEEYLTNGTFVVEILLDHFSNDAGQGELKNHIKTIFRELKNDDINAPSGWYRIGASSTCTGQIEATGELTSTTFGVSDESNDV